MLLRGYSLRRGTGLDRALLVKFMQLTYEELYPAESFSHLSQTVEQYFSRETPLWWVAVDQGRLQLSAPVASQGVFYPSAPAAQAVPIACLWMGTAIDQTTGEQYPHIFLLYVNPKHRRQGVGSALMRHAEDWAKARGDRQIGLQVFQQNRPALELYEKLGYQPQSIWMVKLID